ncbi:MAG: hypothetical protein JWR54_235 [Mucilaginibacter sp.]|nr:hypothetical protein [Mucilaginibacter sp.]
MRVQLINKRPLGDFSSGFFYFKIILCFVLKFEARSSERTWLTAILKNKVIDVYHKKHLYVARWEYPLKLNNRQSFSTKKTGIGKKNTGLNPLVLKNMIHCQQRNFRTFCENACKNYLPYSYLFLP